MQDVLLGEGAEAPPFLPASLPSARPQQGSWLLSRGHWGRRFSPSWAPGSQGPPLQFLGRREKGGEVVAGMVDGERKMCMDVGEGAGSLDWYAGCWQRACVRPRRWNRTEARWGRTDIGALSPATEGYWASHEISHGLGFRLCKMGLSWGSRVPIRVFGTVSGSER